MKVIIGVYDRELSKQLAVILSNKKIFPIEAESFEEIPALLERHPMAMVLTEETSVLFYQKIKSISPKSNIFFLYHPSFSTTELLKLQSFNIRSVIPYSENAEKLVEKILHSLSMNAETMKSLQDTTDNGVRGSQVTTLDDVAIYLPQNKKWVYASLEGFNTSKIAIRLIDQLTQGILLENTEGNFLIYLQSMNIRLYADFIYNKDNIFIFRYRKMSPADAERLSYYIHYCQKGNISHSNLVHELT
ncbi:MAG: hypothetical protein ACRCTJ_06120 [Brevinema sp.]